METGRVAKHLILSAVSENRPFTADELKSYFKMVAKKGYTNDVGCYTFNGRRGQSYQIFKLYFLDQMSIKEKLIYALRKFKAAALRCVGVNSVIVIHIRYCCPAGVDLASHIFE